MRILPMYCKQNNGLFRLSPSRFSEIMVAPNIDDADWLCMDCVLMLGFSRSLFRFGKFSNASEIVPQGRAEDSFIMYFLWIQSSLAGLRIIKGNPHPPLKRWAIINRPDGTVTTTLWRFYVFS